MFAVIKAGGRQYRVAANDVIEIDRVANEIGSTIEFSEVLMVGGPDGTTVGAPTVAGLTVSGEVVDHPRGPKVIAFKKRRRKNSRRTRGHRQHLTLVRVTAIGGVTAAPRAAVATQEDTTGLAPLFTAPEGPGDDLKVISGVGPVLEGKLHALGITTYAQIAAFTPEDIARVDEVLNFKGRIEREGWVGQAAELAKKA